MPVYSGSNQAEKPCLGRTLTSNKFLVLLLIVALLFCYGTFAGLHHSVPKPQAGPSAHAAAPADTVSYTDKQISVCMGNIVAMLFALGTALRLWLVAVRRGLKVCVARPPVTAVLSSCCPYPVRAPALASLQVFRL